MGKKQKKKSDPFAASKKIITVDLSDLEKSGQKEISPLDQALQDSLQQRADVEDVLLKKKRGK